MADRLLGRWREESTMEVVKMETKKESGCKTHWHVLAVQVRSIRVRSVLLGPNVEDT